MQQYSSLAKVRGIIQTHYKSHGHSKTKPDVSPVSICLLFSLEEMNTEITVSQWEYLNITPLQRLDFERLQKVASLDSFLDYLSTVLLVRINSREFSPFWKNGEWNLNLVSISKFQCLMADLATDQLWLCSHAMASSASLSHPSSALLASLSSVYPDHMVHSIEFRCDIYIDILSPLMHIEEIVYVVFEEHIC